MIVTYIIRHIMSYQIEKKTL